jgi:glycosyltransferase involved in cell wall biosynthesis
MQKEKFPTRIIYLWPYRQWGGVQLYFLGLAKTAIKHFKVIAAMPTHSDRLLIEYYNNIGINCEFFNATNDNSYVRGVWPRVLRCFNNQLCNFRIACFLLTRRLQNTIVHADMAPWLTDFWLLYFLTYFCHVITTLHIALPKVKGLRKIEWKLKFWLLSRRKRYRLIVSNKDMLSSLTHYLPASFLNNVKVAYTGIDIDEIESALKLPYDTSTLCSKYGLPSDKFLIVSIARVVQQKGPLVMLAAAKQLVNKYQDLYFVWIGTGPFLNELKNRIAEEGLNNSFRTIEPCEFGGARAELLQILRLADVFALPSYAEGLSGALLEAMAMGKACIATNVNALSEAIYDRETGLLIPPDDSDSLANAIQELYNNEKLRKTISEVGQKLVMQKYDEKNAANVTLQYYLECSNQL